MYVCMYISGCLNSRIYNINEYMLYLTQHFFGLATMSADVGEIFVQKISGK